ncbi:MAG: DUF4115 domain-containing protein [Pseudomonadota bacterium]|jgi:cytoskeleton protein RodZ|nr:DUF4115 domain-containing protein [Xanthomonadaceae bacterium]MDE3211031.1 DUF4115 domain-containing protein [Pseudomonadota bacterium]
MTSSQHPASEHGSSESDLFGTHSTDLPAASTQPHGLSFGAQLHAARKASGASVETCAQVLRLPARVLRQLECDQYDGIDSKVYLSSYIGKYARHLGIGAAAIQHELDRIEQIETPLVATGGISHSRFLLDRYATAATYLVLTLVIVVPTIWFGVRSTLNRDITHLAPLDAAPVAQSETAPVPSKHAQVSAPLPTITPAAVVATPAQDQPLMASMAPFPNLSSDTGAPAESSSVGFASGEGTHSLSLNLSAASWVEVVGADGNRLEYGLLPAGTHKVYHSDQPLDVRIGNAIGAQISVDGRAVALDDFRRANVARFRMQVQDGKASAASL